MKEKTFVTREGIASKLDITMYGVKYNIAKLLSLRIIKRKDLTKGGK